MPHLLGTSSSEYTTNKLVLQSTLFSISAKRNRFAHRLSFVKCRRFAWEYAKNENEVILFTVRIGVLSLSQCDKNKRPAV